MKNYIKLIRPKNWIKNFLIFVPLFFSFTSSEDLAFSSMDNLFYFCYINLMIPFIIFSLLASSIYIINDMFDMESDKNDAVKKNRPLASGAVSLEGAMLLCILCLVSSFAICFFAVMNLEAMAIMALYLVLNLAYSFKLKHMPISDILVLSMFYLIRIYFSSVYYDIPISSYLYLLVLSASLYFGVCKRMKEPRSARVVLKEYSEDYFSNMSILFIALSIFYYSLWVKDYTGIINGSILQLSVIIVISIFMFYHHLVLTGDLSNPVDIVFSSRALRLLIFGYIALILIGVMI